MVVPEATDGLERPSEPSPRRGPNAWPPRGLQVGNRQTLTAGRNHIGLKGRDGPGRSVQFSLSSPTEPGIMAVAVYLAERCGSGMAWSNQTLAEVLWRISDLLAIKGETDYRVSAYRRAADSIEHLGRPAQDLWRDGRLTEIPGVGAALGAKLDELFRTGRLAYYEKLQQEIPAGVVGLLAIPNVGAKTARLMWRGLGVLSVADAEKAAREGELRGLPGLGQRSERRILAAIEALHNSDS